MEHLSSQLYFYKMQNCTAPSLPFNNIFKKQITKKYETDILEQLLIILQKRALSRKS